MGSERETVVKLGWRVVELSREQVDLGLYCRERGPLQFFLRGARRGAGGGEGGVGGVAGDAGGEQS